MFRHGCAIFRKSSVPKFVGEVFIMNCVLWFMVYCILWRAFFGQYVACPSSSTSYPVHYSVFILPFDTKLLVQDVYSLFQWIISNWTLSNCSLTSVYLWHVLHHTHRIVITAFLLSVMAPFPNFVFQLTGTLASSCVCVCVCIYMYWDVALWSHLILPFEIQKEAAKSQRAHEQNNKQISRVSSCVENRRRREFVYV